MYCRPGTYNRGREASPYNVEQGPFGPTINTTRRTFLSSKGTGRLCEELVSEKWEQQDASEPKHNGLQERGYVAWSPYFYSILVCVHYQSLSVYFAKSCVPRVIRLYGKGTGVHMYSSSSPVRSDARTPTPNPPIPNPQACLCSS